MPENQIPRPEGLQSSRMSAALPVCMLLILYATASTSFNGLYDPDESKILYTTLNLLKDFMKPVDAAGIVWPDGLTGPLTYYIHAVNLVLFSYTLSLPMDAAAHIPSLIVMPLTLFFTYHAVKIISDEDSALFSTITLAVLPATMHAGHSILPASLALFMTSLTLFFAARCISSGDMLLAFLTGTAAGLAFLTDVTSIVVLAPVSYMLSTKFRGLKQVDYLNTAALPFILLASPLALHAVLDFNSLNAVLTSGFTGVGYFNGASILSNKQYFITVLEHGLRMPVMVALLAGFLVCLRGRGWLSNLKVLYFAGSLIMLYGLSLTDSMRPYHVYVALIPSVLLVSSFFSAIPEHGFLKTAVVSLILAVTAFNSINDQVFHERNMPFGREVVDGVEYSIGGASVYKRAALFLLNDSSPGDRIIASEPVDFYLLFNRPVVKYDIRVKVGSDVKYIALNGIDNYMLNAYATENLKLAARYNLTQGGRTLIVVYENLGYVKPNETGYQPATTFNLRQAVYRHLESEAMRD
jgi:hypothetical protein